MKPHPYLLLDKRLIRECGNVQMRHGNVRKEPANPLFTEEFFADPPKPWEARVDNMYPNAVYDPADGLYKLWYTAFIRDELSERTPPELRPFKSYRGVANREMGVLYACSEDGLRWRKPELELVEFMGSKRNNLVMRGVHGAGVFIDTCESQRDHRYKMLMKWGERGENAMAVSFSSDGLNWCEPVAWPRHNARGDTHNNTFYDCRTGKYVAFTRDWRDGVRVVARTESDNFIDWTEPVQVFEGWSDKVQLYSMPVFPYGNVYLGFPSLFHTGDPTALNEDRVVCELAWSPDTVEWHRICPGQSFIPLGQGDYPTGDYDCGTIYASAPVIQHDEIWIYYGGSNGRHTAFRETSLGLARCGLDRFAGYAPLEEGAPGYVVTEDIPAGGADALFVTADISGEGWIRAAVIDKDNSEIPGFAFVDCTPIGCTCTSARIAWKGGTLRDLAQETIAFKFEIVGAGSTLYSFRLDDKVRTPSAKLD